METNSADIIPPVFSPYLGHNIVTLLWVDVEKEIKNLFSRLLNLFRFFLESLKDIQIGCLWPELEVQGHLFSTKVLNF